MQSDSNDNMIDFDSHKTMESSNKNSKDNNNDMSSTSTSNNNSDNNTILSDSSNNNDQDKIMDIESKDISSAIKYYTIFFLA